MTTYVCNNCGFRIESEKPVKRCPYCDHLSLEKEKSAEELVNEVDII